jgi:hypothetical protein
LVEVINEKNLREKEKTGVEIIKKLRKATLRCLIEYFIDIGFYVVI